MKDTRTRRRLGAIAAILAAMALIFGGGSANASNGVPDCPDGLSSSVLRNPGFENPTPESFTSVYTRVPDVFQRVDVTANDGYQVPKMFARFRGAGGWTEVTPLQPTGVTTSVISEDGLTLAVEVCWAEAPPPTVQA